MTTASLAAHRQPVQNRWQPARRGFTNWRRRAGVKLQHAVAGATRLRRGALTVTGLGLVDASAFHLGSGAGLLATGASVLVFEWLSSSD